MMELKDAMSRLTEYATKGTAVDELGHVFVALATVAHALNLPEEAEAALKVCEQLLEADRARMEADTLQLQFMDLLRATGGTPPPTHDGDGDGNA